MYKYTTLCSIRQASKLEDFHAHLTYLSRDGIIDVERRFYEGTLHDGQAKNPAQILDNSQQLW
jgi:hypothetical protein